jgi:quercetin dioxygenase-like cupin family protein
MSESLVDLNEIGRSLLEQARAAGNGRAADTVQGGSDRSLRQTVLGMTAGAELGEHESPGEATLQVLSGAVELRSASNALAVSAGQLATIPSDRHSLLATTDAVVILTVVKSLS